MLALNLLIFGCLVLITYQDFKLRAVYWWIFPLLLISLCSYKSMETGGRQMLDDLLHNISFLGSQLLFLIGYFSLKERKWVNIFEHYLGLGDLFFLISITVYLSFLNYVLFYLLSLFAIVFFTVVTHAFIKNRNPKIPLAGYQAALFGILILADQLSTDINILSDLGLVKFLNW